MPALVLFRRRWLIGSDDLVLPAFIDLLYRSSWLVAVLIIYCKQESQLLLCENGQAIQLYLYTTFSLLHLAIFSDVGLIHVSKNGHAMDSKDRKYVPILIYIRLGLSAIEFLTGILASFGFYNNYFLCENAPTMASLMKGLTLNSWITTGILIFICYILYNPAGSTSLENFEFGFEQNELPPATKYSQIWESRCKFFGCVWYHRPHFVQQGFEEIGRLFGAAFQNLDLVPSDLSSGLYILYLRKRSQSQLLRDVISEKAVITSEPFIRKSRDMKKLVDEEWDSTTCLNYFIKYALACYTYKLLIYVRKNPWKSLWKNSVCCACIPGVTKPTGIEGDNCCFCHSAAVKDLSESEYEDIVLSSFKNDYFRIPYIVTVDHETNSIIISIRGSLTFEDLITDLTCWPAPLQINGLPSKFMAHHGFIMSAIAIKKKLDHEKILPRLFAQYPLYQLVLTGHSLGAALASLIAMMIRPAYPKLKCYAYAPPGGVLCQEAAEYCNDFVLSVTYGDDMIARLSILSCENLKYNIINALESCKTPKYRLLLSACCLCSSSCQHLTEEENVSEEKPLDSQLLQQDNNNKPQPGRRQTGLKCIRLYPPGRIARITETNYSDQDFASSHPRWTIEWCKRSHFDNFIISPRMILDHVPFRLMKSLEYFGNHETKCGPFELN